MLLVPEQVRVREPVRVPAQPEREQPAQEQEPVPAQVRESAQVLEQSAQVQERVPEQRVRELPQALAAL